MVGEDPVDGFPAEGIWIIRGQRMESTENDQVDTDNMEDFVDTKTKNFLDYEHDIR